MANWKAIPGYEGLYEVSDDGQVFSIRWNRVMKSKTVVGKKYKHIGLRRNREPQKMYLIHRLVLLSFVGPPPTSEHECLHGNDIHDDNRLENLSWGTHQQNMSDAQERGRMVGTKTSLGLFGEKHPTAKKVHLVNAENEIIKTFGCIRTAAKELGVHHGSIWFVCTGRRLSVRGYKFKYAA